MAERSPAKGVEAALEALQRDPRLGRHVAVWRRLPARPGRSSSFPAELHPDLVAALRRVGIDAPYTHQAAAIAAALRGENVAVVTPAASGKTLCYNVPTVHRLMIDPQARALYLFPTKALAQDQLAALHELLAVLASGSGGTSLAAATYDGDTPSSHRSRVRDGARIVLSNADMLHAGILPQHPRWAAFFANLRVVVLDEMHAYRGVFGSHVADVLRRLRRICRFYGATPQFLLASATIANPADLAARLVEAPVTVVGPDLDGAPQGERHILLYNPPLLDPALGIRRSSSLEATELAAHFLAHDVQTIVFGGSRLTTELILTYLRERPEKLPATAAYRGGYLATARRAIERALRSGEIRGVVATNALELGIDIGQLEASILAGYPGTIAGTWQQMGRAGRRRGAAAGVLVASADAIDQYLLAHPDYLFDRSPEHALVNPDNPVILAAHLACAAAELPFAPGEGFGGAPDVDEALAFLADAGELYTQEGRYYWAGAGSPSAAISLRTASPDRVVIQTSGDLGSETAKSLLQPQADPQVPAAGRASGPPTPSRGKGRGAVPQVLGEIERAGAPLLLYEGAIYIHAGESYLVERLDWDGGVAHVRPVAVDYYTRASISEDVQVLAERARRTYPSPEEVGTMGQETGLVPLSLPPVPYAELAWGDVRVVSKATGYRILRRYSNEVLGFGRIDLPEQVLETAGCWLALESAFVEGLKAEGLWLSAPNDYGPDWPAQRAAARARDGFRCQACGVPEPAASSPASLREHDVHHKIPLRAFVADPTLRPGLPPELAYQAANTLENLVTLCPACHRRAEAGVRLRSGLGGLATLLAGVAPLFLMCDPRDLGLVAEPQAPGSGLPTLTLYEKVPAGVGYAAQLYELMPELLLAARDVVAGCPCRQGCPSCVGPVLDHPYALDTKALTAALLERLCARPIA